MVKDAREKQDARLIAAQKQVAYATALRWLRNQVYVVTSGEVTHGINWVENHR